MDKQNKKHFEQLTWQLLTSGEMERILDFSYDGIWITDGNGQVLYVNSANERMLGVRREDVLGKMSEELVSSRLFESSAPLEVIKQKKPVSMMGYNYKTDKNVLITGNPIFDDNGNIKYIITNVRDVSQINEMMSQIQKQDQVIEEQRQEINRLLSASHRSKENCGIVGNSKQTKQVLELAERVSHFDSTVLVLGESGVGKEVVVRHMVHLSDRADKPFVKVNCGAIPENLLESELFGYEKGAFTGAGQKGKPGMFELANGGTIFLDEIGELQLNLQVKLLRVLQEKEIQRIGGTKPVKLDVRVIAATNQDMEHMVLQGTFRKDLYYRLNVVCIQIPPLRERPEDIPLLIRHFLKQFNAVYHVNRSITPGALQALSDYHWPGNIRELQNVIENLVVMAATDTIDTDSLSQRFFKETAAALPETTLEPLKEAVCKLEARLITQAMKQYKTTRQAAQALGVDQSTIVRKLKAMKQTE